MSRERVIVLATFEKLRLVETLENPVMSPGWAIGRQEMFFRPMAILRKFEFKDEADRAWLDTCNGASDHDIQNRDYSGAPPLGETIPLAEHPRPRRRDWRDR